MKAEWTNNDSLTTSQTTKAILVIDKMPNSCDECIVRCDGYTAKEYFEKNIKRPSWCPLKPIPQPKGYIDAIEWYLTEKDGSMFTDGWNACINAIIGDTDGTKGEK